MAWKKRELCLGEIWRFLWLHISHAWSQLKQALTEPQAYPKKEKMLCETYPCGPVCDNRHWTKKRVKGEKVDGSIVKAMMKLQPDEVPDRLMQEPPIKSNEDFNPNAYLDVLPNLKIKPGYVLDWVYDYVDHFSGAPCIYARKIEEKPFGLYEEYKKWCKNDSLECYLFTDGTPNGFFQFVAFMYLSSRFYQYWHSNYYDVKILTSTEEIEDLILEINKNLGPNFTKKQIFGLRSVRVQPRVYISNDTATIVHCLFSKWGGLIRVKDFYDLQAPHYLRKRIVLQDVMYNCRVRY